jgi:hypothetical protein
MVTGFVRRNMRLHIFRNIFMAPEISLSRIRSNATEHKLRAIEQLQFLQYGI